MSTSYCVTVAGSRTFDDFDLLAETLGRVLVGKEGVVIVSGGAKGADQFGERYAQDRGLGVEQHTPDWKTHGKCAGMIRNGVIVDVSDHTLFFWDGVTRGTADGIKKSEKRRIPAEVVRYGELRPPETEK